MKYLLATLMIMTSVVFGVEISREKAPQKTDEQNVSSAEEPYGSVLVLKYYDGAVRLFEGDTVIDTFSEINFQTLPSTDRQILSDGIRLSNIAEAYDIIEDFDG